MKIKLSSRVILAIILCCVLLGTVCIGVNQFFSSKEKNILKIISIDVSNTEKTENFTVTVKIQNTGSNNVNNAELNLIFIKENDIIDSEKQSIHLESNLEETYIATFSDVPFETGDTFKAIATIYLDSLLLDTKTNTKQF